MATDIAFAVGILVLLAWRIPKNLIVFLTALAIADDLGADAFRYFVLREVPQLGLCQIVAFIAASCVFDASLITPRALAATPAF